MAEINFKNQYPIFAEKQKKLWPRIKEIFTRKPKDKFGFQPSPQNFGEKLKSFAETTKERFVDNWFRNAPLSPLSSSNLQPGSLFKKYTPKPTVTPEPKGVVLADKTDVRRSRVVNKKPKRIKEDIHDRVNFATKISRVRINKKKKLITLILKIDTGFVPVIEYFEIFTDRMVYCRKAAKFLGYKFGLIINNFKLL